MQNDSLALADAEEARALGREVTLEQVIPWGPVLPEAPGGIWTAHADYADWTDHVVIEYTGSADLSPDRRKMLQSAFYAKRLTEITGVEWGAFVKVFDPSTGEERYLSINWREIVWEIDVVIADLIAALEVRVEPDRIDSAGETVCESPGDGPAMFCPFAGWCFRGYEYPTMGVLEGAAAEQAVEVARLAEATKTTLLDKDRRVASKRLASLIAPSTKYRVPLEDGREVQVSYSPIPGRRTISLKEMDDAGFHLPDELLQFVKEGDPSVRVNTKIVEAVPDGA